MVLVYLFLVCGVDCLFCHNVSFVCHSNISWKEKTMTEEQLQEIWCEVNFLWEQYVATKDELCVSAIALRQMLIDSFVEILRKQEEGEWRAWL
jgi:hypothetical protein